MEQETEVVDVGGVSVDNVDCYGDQLREWWDRVIVGGMVVVRKVGGGIRRWAAKTGESFGDLEPCGGRGRGEALFGLPSVRGGFYISVEAILAQEGGL